MNRLSIGVLAAILVTSCKAFETDATPPGTTDDAGTSSSGPPGGDPDAGPPTPPPPLGERIVLAQSGATLLAVDATAISWWEPQARRLVTVTKDAPGTPRITSVAATATVTSLARDGSRLLWTEIGASVLRGESSAGVMAVTTTTLPVVVKSIPTGTLTQVAGMVSGYVAALGPQTLQVLNTTTGTACPEDEGDSGPLIAAGDVFVRTTKDAVVAVRPATCERETVAAGLTVEAMVADATHLFALSPRQNTVALERVPLVQAPTSTESTTPLANLPDDFKFVAVASGFVFVGSSYGEILRMPRDGGAPLPVEQLSGLVALAADADGLYWITDAGQLVWLRTLPQ